MVLKCWFRNTFLWEDKKYMYVCMETQGWLFIEDKIYFFILLLKEDNSLNCGTKNLQKFYKSQIVGVYFSLYVFFLEFTDCWCLFLFLCLSAC